MQPSCSLCQIVPMSCGWKFQSRSSRGDDGDAEDADADDAEDAGDGDGEEEEVDFHSLNPTR